MKLNREKHCCCSNLEIEDSIWCDLALQIYERKELDDVVYSD
jgi:hypothetical protein